MRSVAITTSVNVNIGVKKADTFASARMRAIDARPLQVRFGLTAAKFIVLVVAALSNAAHAAGRAEVPVPGGLGVRFGQPVDTAAMGFERPAPAEFPLPTNVDLTLPELVPGTALPWRWLRSPVLPRPFRNAPHEAWVMLNEAGEPMRIAVKVELEGCTEAFEWLTETLVSKYAVNGAPDTDPPQGFDRAIRVVSAGRQIDARCGKWLGLEYSDFDQLTRWADRQKNLRTRYDRQEKTREQRQIVLDARRAHAYADTFTLGDQYRLTGAFGIAFEKPFAPNSTQQFPHDQPFFIGLPNLPEAFREGEILLEIAPNRVPIVIRGTFKGLEFEDLAAALRSKFGTPVKASERHIVHRVSNKRAILKRLPGARVELTFIDIEAQEDQRARRWAAETEGL